MQETILPAPTMAHQVSSGLPFGAWPGRRPDTVPQPFAAIVAPQAPCWPARRTAILSAGPPCRNMIAAAGVCSGPCCGIRRHRTQIHTSEERMKNNERFPAPTMAALAFGLAFAASASAADMSFFITSTGGGKGADLGGLAGADRHCQTLANAAGAGGHVWRAYL